MININAMATIPVLTATHVFLRNPDNTVLEIRFIIKSLEVFHFPILGKILIVLQPLIMK